MTDFGVVPVNGRVFYGHVFDDATDQWVLYAKKPTGSKEKYKKRGATAPSKHHKLTKPCNAAMSTRSFDESVFDRKNF